MRGDFQRKAEKKAHGSKALERGAKMRSEEDALGSYTGTPYPNDGEPEQDADDL